MRFDITTSDNVLCLKKAGTNEILKLINGDLFLKKHRYNDNKLLVSKDDKLDTEHDALICIECNRVATVNGAGFRGNAYDLMIVLKPFLQSISRGNKGGQGSNNGVNSPKSILENQHENLQNTSKTYSNLKAITFTVYEGTANVTMSGTTLTYPIGGVKGATYGVTSGKLNQNVTINATNGKVLVNYISESLIL